MQRLLVAVLLLSMLAACAAPAADVSAPPSPETANNAQSDNTSAENPGEDEEQAEAFRTRTASPADMQGVVTSVVGNEVTLKLIEPVLSGGSVRFSADNMPEDFNIEEFDPENLPEGFELPEGFDPDNMPNLEISQNPDGAFSVTLPEGTDVNEMRERAMEFFDANGGEGGAFQGRGAVQGGTRRAVQGGGISGLEIEVTYTGEEASAIIPVGMLSSTPEKKQILMLWHDENGEIINARLAGTAKE